VCSYVELDQLNGKCRARGEGGGDGGEKREERCGGGGGGGGRTKVDTEKKFRYSAPVVVAQHLLVQQAAYLMWTWLKCTMM
jgi:hypothetical protein